MKTKTIVITAIVIAAILFLWKRAKAATGGAAFKLQANWGEKLFSFTHPALGTHTFKNPQGQEGAYNAMVNTNELQLGWTRVPGNKIVVTLLHKTGSVFSEVYVLDLNTKSAQYYSELNPVTVTA